jgi:alpha-glucosidase
MYVVYESPLVMVSDYPEAYEGQPGLEFIEKVPTVWDDTKVLGGKPAEHVAIARRNGDGWWIGAMTSWDARDLDLPLDFLGAGEYEATLFIDGADAATVATSLEIAKKTVKAGDRLALKLAPGGGAAVMLTPIK